MLHAGSAGQDTGFSLPDGVVGCQETHGRAGRTDVDRLFLRLQGMYHSLRVVAVRQAVQGSRAVSQGMDDECPVANALGGWQGDRRMHACRSRDVYLHVCVRV